MKNNAIPTEEINLFNWMEKAHAPKPDDTTMLETVTVVKVSQAPLMKQYSEMKKKHPDAILLFRVGDFYELFGEDAVYASKTLGLILTTGANGVALAGFPHHALDSYMPRLVRSGRRVAICEQLSKPSKSK